MKSTTITAEIVGNIYMRACEAGHSVISAYPCICGTNTEQICHITGALDRGTHLSLNERVQRIKLAYKRPQVSNPHVRYTTAGSVDPIVGGAKPLVKILLS